MAFVHHLQITEQGLRGDFLKILKVQNLISTFNKVVKTWHTLAILNFVLLLWTAVNWYIFQLLWIMKNFNSLLWCWELGWGIPFYCFYCCWHMGSTCLSEMSVAKLCKFKTALSRKWHNKQQKQIVSAFNYRGNETRSLTDLDLDLNLFQWSQWMRAVAPHPRYRYMRAAFSANLSQSSIRQARCVVVSNLFRISA